MRDVQLQKTDLVDRIKLNMSTHRETYEKAVELFKAKQIAELERMLAAAKADKDFNRAAINRLPVPEDHTDDYKVALEMLELEEREVLTLSQDDFRRYYLDEWEWRRSWASNTEAYTVGAIQ